MNVWNKLQRDHSFEAYSGKAFFTKLCRQSVKGSRRLSQNARIAKEIYAARPQKTFDPKPYVVRPVNAVVVESNDPISGEYAKFVKSI